MFICASYFSGLADAFWINQETKYVVMSALWVILFWTIQLLTQLYDAHGITISVEIVKVIQKVLILAVISSLLFL